MLSRRTLLAGAMSAAIAPVARANIGGPITIIVPFVPGASTDAIARMTATFFTDQLKSTTIVDNRAGGGGSIGLMAVSRAAPDGLTIGVGATGAVVVNPHVAGSPPFDPLTQLTAIAKLVDIPLVLVANKSTGLKTIQDVVAKSKETPQGLNFGSTGVNSSQHLSVEVLKQITGAKLTHVPYRGSAAAATDLIGGQLPLACVDLTAVYEHVKSGNLTAIGVTANSRYTVAGEIPTFAEQGLKGFDIRAWIGMFGPRGLSPELVEKYASTLQKAVADPEIASRARQVACEPAYLGPVEFSAFLAAQSASMKPLVASVEVPK